MRALAHMIGAMGALLGALLVAGCTSSQVTVSIASENDTNGGAPFYAVVRAVEQATYVTDSYDSIAAKVFANPPDPTVLRSEVIYPGQTAELKVPKPEVLPIAVYFLFTTPGERWKTSFNQPLPRTVDIELERNQIKNGGAP